MTAHDPTPVFEKCPAHSGVKNTLILYGTIATIGFSAIFWVSMRNYADNKEKIGDTNKKIDSFEQKIDVLTDKINQVITLVKIHIKDTKEDKP